MLVEFSVANFRSIKERITLSMVASPDPTLEKNCFPLPGRSRLRLLKSAAIYGPNASGKSNLVKALAFVQDFVVNSASRGQRGDPISVTPFMLGLDEVHDPSEFEIVLGIQDKRYVYGFTVNREHVIEEWLTEIAVKPRRLFTRSPDGSLSFGEYWKGEKAQLAKLLRPNALLLSVAVQLNSEAARPIFDWFRDRLSVVSDQLAFEPAGFLTLVKLRTEEAGFGDRLRRLIQVADLGIASVALRPYQKGMSDALPGMMEGYVLAGAGGSQQVGAEVNPADPPVDGLGVQAVHVAEHGREVSFDFSEESAGTRRLFQLAGPWFGALDAGGVFLVDELERSLHPILMRYLIEGFHASPASQLIFTTHNVDLLDDDVFRRDQVWLIEKDASAASRLRSLWEYRIRKDENVRHGYLKGRYGATPLIGGDEPWRLGA